MKKLLLSLATASVALALTACGEPEPEVVDSRAPDPLAAEKAKKGPVELPPSIRASVSFRCEDNSLLYVDFFNGDKLANIRLDKKDGLPTQLRAENAGDPYTGSDYTLKGDEKNVTLTKPGGGTLSCHL